LWCREIEKGQETDWFIDNSGMMATERQKKCSWTAAGHREQTGACVNSTEQCSSLRVIKEKGTTPDIRIKLAGASYCFSSVQFSVIWPNMTVANQTGDSCMYRRNSEVSAFDCMYREFKAMTTEKQMLKSC
jgi:hypothetical protein